MSDIQFKTINSMITDYIKKKVPIVLLNNNVHSSSQLCLENTRKQ